MATYSVREECDERTGEYRENEAGKDRDPLHFLVRKMGFGVLHQSIQDLAQYGRRLATSHGFVKFIRDCEELFMLRVDARD